MDIASTQQGTSRVGRTEGPQIPECLCQETMGSSTMEESKKYTNSYFMGRKSKPLKPVIFKCHWFDPHAVRQTLNLGLVEVQQASVYPGDDVYIVAQQATQVYYLSYPCQTDNHLKSWDVVYKVSPHGKLPVPNNEGYNIDPNTYAGEFFQEEGLEETFQIDLTKAM